MKIQEALNFVESLKNETENTSEIKVYENFLDILAKLKGRAFSHLEVQSIETELDSLNSGSNSENRKKHFTKLLKEFKDYLKEKHSLIPAGYYTNMGITTGAGFGVIAGIIIGERFEKSLGIGIGMLIGLIIWRSMDAKALGESNVL